MRRRWLNSLRTIRIWNKRDRFKTEQEKLILNDFNMIGLYPVWQYQIGRYIADFAFPDKKICIEINGGIHTRTDIKIRDKIKKKYYIKMGWLLIVIDMENISNYKELLFSIKRMVQL